MEEYFLSRAFGSKDSLGRHFQEDSFGFNSANPFSYDLFKITNSLAFKRLRNKTQVIFPAGDYHQTRLSHSLETAVNGSLVANRLGLNESLVYAMMMAHDIGHVPFGHFGEKFLSLKLKEHFRHENFGVFLVQEIEPLNLSYEILDFIPYHSRGPNELAISNNVPLCFNIGMYVDKISYTISDSFDIFSSNILKVFPPPSFLYLGKNRAERLKNCLEALCAESIEKGIISFLDSEVAKNFLDLRDFMYSQVYSKLDEIREDTQGKPLEKIYQLFRSYDFPTRKAVLTIALMTENEILQILDDNLLYGKTLTSNKFFNNGYNISKLLPIIEKKYLTDFLDPDLSWAKKS